MTGDQRLTEWRQPDGSWGPTNIVSYFTPNGCLAQNPAAMAARYAKDFPENFPFRCGFCGEELPLNKWDSSECSGTDRRS